jgi:hypothetical protein
LGGRLVRNKRLKSELCGHTHQAVWRAGSRAGAARGAAAGVCQEPDDWVVVLAAICAWWLFHTNPKWIFPAGWWRL